jgi:tRNA (Thr-GGU) A37 N-methylase
VCKLLKVDRNSVRVEGLDLVDGTPVLDIKPYIPEYDSNSTAILPEWAYEN